MFALAAGTATGSGSGSRRKWPWLKGMDPEGGSLVGSIVGVSRHTRRQLTDGIRRRRPGPRRPGPEQAGRAGSQKDPRTAAAYCGAQSGRCDTRAWMPGPQRAAGARTRAVDSAPSCSPVDLGHRLEDGGSEGEAVVRRGGDGVGSWEGEERRTMTLIPPMVWAGLGWAWMFLGFGFIGKKGSASHYFFFQKKRFVDPVFLNFDMA